MATTTRNRVPRHTATDVNRTIQQSVENSIRYHQKHKNQIPSRLQELDEEWDIERAIQANAAAASLLGLIFGLIGKSRWFLLPAAASGVLLQQAVQGSCPLIPVLRRLGFRTAYEIELERQALKLIRGDYKSAADGDADAGDLLEAVQT